MSHHFPSMMNAVIFFREAEVPEGTTIKEYRCDGLYNVRFNAVGSPASVTITNPHATDPLLIGIASAYSVLAADYTPLMKVGAGESQEVIVSPGSYFFCWASDVSSADRAIVASTDGAYVSFATTDTIINEAYDYNFDVDAGKTSNFILTFNSPTTGTVTLQLLDSANAVIGTQTVDVALGANSITWSSLESAIPEGADYVMRITPVGTGLSSLSVDLDLTGGGGNLGPQDIADDAFYLFGPVTVPSGKVWPVRLTGTLTGDGFPLINFKDYPDALVLDVDSDGEFDVGPIDKTIEGHDLPAGTYTIRVFLNGGGSDVLEDATLYATFIDA
jgi:hypothetical protein